MAGNNGIELEGVDDLMKRLGQLADEGRKVEGAALRKGGDVMKASVEQEAPVQSGKLRRSIKRSGVRGDADGRYVLIWPSAFYAHMVEFGTVKMRANPFTARGYESSRAETMAVILAEVRKGLGL